MAAILEPSISHSGFLSAAVVRHSKQKQPGEEVCLALLAGSPLRGVKEGSQGRKHGGK